jgi:hypothetical protein
MPMKVMVVIERHIGWKVVYHARQPLEPGPTIDGLLGRRRNWFDAHDSTLGEVCAVVEDDYTVLDLSLVGHGVSSMKDCIRDVLARATDL